MKKLFTFFLLLSGFFLTNQVYSQRIYGALSAGMNLTQVDGDEVYGYRHVGFNIGPSVILPFTRNKKWTITLELLYSRVGSYDKYPDIDTLPRPYYRLNLDYATVPVLVHFVDKNVVAAGVGFSYGQLVDVKEWEHGARTQTTLQGPYKKNDIDVLADVKVRLWQRLWFNFRYAYSMVNIRVREYNNTYKTWDRKQYNNVLTFRFTYVFNEPLYAKTKEKKGK
ncbi:MAG: outer membrane beta-barrel protein [Bacteroidetes bacterium]|nr:outer membrane beta-barrel protein [Bacteroidota bacterium]